MHRWESDGASHVVLAGPIKDGGEGVLASRVDLRRSERFRMCSRMDLRLTMVIRRSSMTGHVRRLMLESGTDKNGVSAMGGQGGSPQRREPGYLIPDSQLKSPMPMSTQAGTTGNDSPDARHRPFPDTPSSLQPHSGSCC